MPTMHLEACNQEPKALLKCLSIHTWKHPHTVGPSWRMCVCLPSHLCAVTKVTRIKCRHNRSLFFSPSDLSPSTDKSCQNNKKCKTAELFMKSHMKVIRGNKSLRIASKRRMCVPISESRGGGTVLLIWSADEKRDEAVCRIVYLFYLQGLIEVWNLDVWESSSVVRHILPFLIFLLFMCTKLGMRDTNISTPLAGE